MKKVYLETFGCQMNVSDSERVATSLSAQGYEMISDEAAADVVLLNTCSVREKAEHKLYTRVGQIRKSLGANPLIGVIGCVAQLEGETLFEKSQGIDFVIGTKAVSRVAQAIEATNDGKRFYFDLGDREAEYDWSVSKFQRKSTSVAFVPIIEGCNKFCTYCIVPFSRGREKSLTAKSIIEQILQLKDEGVKEIHLIGQNVNSYRPLSKEGLEGFPGATPFSQLLRAVASSGIPRVKFATSFPRDFNDDIVDAIDEHENLCNWVHLPVQSGSNSVLKSMRRGHTIESYIKTIDKIKASSKNIAITTDIIVGFPTETEEDFEDTVSLYKYCEFDAAYIFKYSPRFGTPAYEMGDTIDLETKNNRFARLEYYNKQFQSNGLDKLLNQTVDVLAEKKSSKVVTHFTGHTTCHKIVNFEGRDGLLGQIVKVKITEKKSNGLFGVYEL